MANEELELDVNQPKGSKMTTILLIVLILLVLVIGGVGAWLFLGKDKGADTAGGSSAAADKQLQPLTYFTLTPEFIVNFGPGSKVRYLQVDIQVATRDEAAIQTITTYRPVIRNDILVMLSGTTFDELKTRSGKEALQKKLLNTINTIVVASSKPGDETNSNQTNEKKDNSNADKSEHVEGPIENVYFTSFIMQ